MSKSVVKTSFSKKNSAVKTVSKNDASLWWKSGVSEEKAMLDMIPKMESRFAMLPNGAGALRLFKKGMGLKLRGVLTMSAPDDNRKICLELDQDTYEYLKHVEEILDATLLTQLRNSDGRYCGSELKSSVKESEETGRKYLKTKIQVLGSSRSIGVDEKGGNVTDAIGALGVAGTKVNVRVKIDGVYAGVKDCGLVTKIDMFQILNVPDARELEEARRKRKEEIESKRMSEMNDFMEEE